MMLAALKITPNGLARSQPMRNTLAAIEREFRSRGLAVYWATASVM